jgi:hypothetical protein
VISATDAAIWGIAGLATFGVIVRPWHWPEFIWAISGARAAALFVHLRRHRQRREFRVADFQSG